MKGTITAIKPKVVTVNDGHEVFKGGFGFIRGEDGTDRFFHANGVAGAKTFDQLVEGLAVEFEPYSQPGSGGNSQRARSVRVLNAN